MTGRSEERGTGLSQVSKKLALKHHIHYRKKPAGFFINYG